MFYTCQRVPRKLKKKWKHILQVNRYKFLDLNQKLWYILYLKDKCQHAKIIKEILDYENRDRN